MIELIRRYSSPVQEEDVWERFVLGGLNREQFRWSILDPLLQVIPKSKPTPMEDITSAFVLGTQFEELGTIGN